MAVEHIQYTDTLRQGADKINAAIDQSNEAIEKATTADANANQALTTANDVQTQLNTIVIEGDSSVEAAQARVDAEGRVFTTLKERLDTKETQFSQGINDIKSNSIYPVFNVNGFGAKGDGLTDDTAAIQTAIDTAGTVNGGIVYFPPGNYYVTNSITLYSNIFIKGCAQGNEFANSCRIFTDQAIDIFTLNESPSKTIRISDIMLDGLNIGLSALNVGRGIVYLDHIYVESFSNRGIYLNNAWCTKIFNCFIRGNVIGIEFGQSANAISVSNCRILNNQTGIKFSGSAHKVSIFGTSIEGGINGVEFEANDPDGVTIEECYFEQISNRHILVKTGSAPARNLIIQKNHMHGSNMVSYAIELQAGNGVKIQDNSIFSYTTAGIYVSANANGVEIKNNVREQVGSSVSVVDDSGGRAIVTNYFLPSQSVKISNEFSLFKSEQTFDNLVNNGSFENNANGWTSISASVSVSTTTGVYHGLKALTITPSNTNGRIEQTLNVNFNYAIGRILSCSFYVDVGTSSRARFRVYTNTGNVASLEVTKTGFYTVYGRVPTGSTQMIVALYPDNLNGTGAATFDAISIVFGPMALIYDHPKQARIGGETVNRPSNPNLYQMYFDSNLNKPIWWNGTVWVDANGNTV